MGISIKNMAIPQTIKLAVHGNHSETSAEKGSLKQVKNMSQKIHESQASYKA